MSRPRFACTTFEELNTVFSLTKETFPDKRVLVDFDYAKKQYILSLDEQHAPDCANGMTVPIDLNISVVYGDTDSVFLRFSYNRADKKANRYDTFRLAQLCGTKLTDEVFNRKPIDMEFEKVFNPLILLAKKNYIGKKFEDLKNPLKMKCIDSKGIALTRRNYCNIVKRCYAQIIDCIMDREFDGVDDSIAIFKDYLQKIKRYDVPFDDLVITASYAKSYKTENLPHVHLAKKLRQRKEEVQVGDRIPYIFIEQQDATMKKFEKAEDPKYAEHHGLRFDRLCYLDQLIKPIVAFYKIVLVEYPDALRDVLIAINSCLVDCGGKPIKKLNDITAD